MKKAWVNCTIFLNATYRLKCVIQTFSSSFIPMNDNDYFRFPQIDMIWSGFNPLFALYTIVMGYLWVLSRISCVCAPLFELDACYMAYIKYKFIWLLFTSSFIVTTSKWRELRQMTTIKVIAAGRFCIWLLVVFFNQQLMIAFQIMAFD